HRDEPLVVVGDPFGLAEQFQAARIHRIGVALIDGGENAELVAEMIGDAADIDVRGACDLPQGDGAETALGEQRFRRLQYRRVSVLLAHPFPALGPSTEGILRLLNFLDKCTKCEKCGLSSPSRYCG